MKIKYYTSIIIFLLIVSIKLGYCGDREYYFDGVGRTRDDAIAAALRNGIDEIYGVSIEAESVVRSNLDQENRMILIRQAKGLKYKVTSVEFTDKYKTEYRAHIKVIVRTFHPSESVWRSAVVPGWGQFYKGNSIKGWVALSGTSGLLLGGVLTAKHSNEMNERSNKSVTQYRRNYYNDEATKYHQISLVCYGLAAGMYALNVFDAISSPLGFESKMIPEISTFEGYYQIRLAVSLNIDNFYGRH
ncbi:hypothetical protein K8I28_09030 [bacterium]|nr:hypothetical protein [bacterium]